MVVLHNLSFIVDKSHKIAQNPGLEFVSYGTDKNVNPRPN